MSESQTKFAMYPSLRERVVVITGGASGIGEALVEAFAAQGSRVVFLDRQREAGEMLVERMRAARRAEVSFRRCDLADTEALQRSVKEIAEEAGVVHALVNNAGDDTRHSVEEVTPAMWDRTMAINLKQQFFMTQGLLPAMRRAGGASIVNMSSIAWIIPSTSVPVYVAAKAAIVGMTRTLAHELGGEAIRVNSILPGAIETERQRRLWLTAEYKAEILRAQALKRMIGPEEVARLALFLAAEDSAAITGQAYVIDGGWV